MGTVAAAVLGLAPMLAYAGVLWWFDRYEKEPTALLTAAFLWGAAPAVLFSLLVQLVIGLPIAHFASFSAADTIGSSLIAPVTEEVFKAGALVLMVAFFRSEIDDALDGIIYGGMIGFGFASVENIFYFASILTASGWVDLLPVVGFRAMLFGLNHAFFTGLVGLGVSIGTTSSRAVVRMGAPVIALLAAVVAHAGHNICLSLGEHQAWPLVPAILMEWAGVLTLVGVMLWAAGRERDRIELFLAGEVVRGTLTERQYSVVKSYRRRFAERMGAILAGDLVRWVRLGRYYRLATELSFLQCRIGRSPGDEKDADRIALLRDEVCSLGQVAWRRSSP
jgi:RsiW-degrading membrane proteinase PrsW (M82 family)